MSPVTFFLGGGDKGVKLIGGVSVINGEYPVLFLLVRMWPLTTLWLNEVQETG